MIVKILLLILLSLVGATFTLLIINYMIKPYIKSKVSSAASKEKSYLIELWLLAFFGGFLEVLLYGGSFLIDKPEFILIWLGVKTALRWDRKRNEKEESRDKEYRGLFYSFLIGSALNIIWGYIIFCIVSGKPPCI